MLQEVYNFCNASVELVIAQCGRVRRQNVQESARDIPAEKFIPQCSLEIVADVQVNRIFSLISAFFHQLLHHRHHSRVSADANLTQAFLARR